MAVSCRVPLLLILVSISFFMTHGFHWRRPARRHHQYWFATNSSNDSTTCEAEAEDVAEEDKTFTYFLTDPNLAEDGVEISLCLCYQFELCTMGDKTFKLELGVWGRPVPPYCDTFTNKTRCHHVSAVGESIVVLKNVTFTN